jgi:nucleoid DNA-binding protein
MKTTEIVELIKQSNPKLLGKMPDAKMAKIIAAILREIGKQVSATESGDVKIAGLGTFKVRQVEREKDGNTVSVKKIAFRSVKLKATEKN